ncbi:MAG: hypothetical protein JEZ03_07995 [Bacteroidales bacterium]|nr:hypothetical protein [Bacteroidales bacterium]
MKTRHQILILIFSLLSGGLFAQKLSFQGQLSNWATVNSSNQVDAQVGSRYIPILKFKKDTIAKGKIDAEVSMNMYGSAFIGSWDQINMDGTIKPYRMWLRYSRPQFEIRAGLQKINFGSANTLRPLMWFDRMDPRDPLQLTDGVYGLLGRYYFLNNANLWLWCLYGNKDTKGWEAAPTQKREPEFGGRIQYPVSTGELAFSAHYRKADLSQVKEEYPSDIMENRIALDGKWDMEAGVWFEAALIKKQTDSTFLKNQKMLTLGMDYTFGLGNGLNVATEFFMFDNSPEVNEFNNGFAFSTLSANYPLGLIDNVSAMVYYDWTNKELYRFVNWNRTYDNWQVYLMAFWNPDQFQIYPNLQEGSLFAGKGIQIMIVWNH